MYIASVSVSVSAEDGIAALGKAHTRSAPSLSSLPKVALDTVSAYICLVEHRSLSTLEGGMSAASFLHSPFLQAINAVMLWPVHVQKVLQASEHLCPTKLQTRCDICCVCQSICPFISIDSGVPNTLLRLYGKHKGQGRRMQLIFLHFKRASLLFSIACVDCLSAST